MEVSVPETPQNGDIGARNFFPLRDISHCAVIPTVGHDFNGRDEAVHAGGT